VLLVLQQFVVFASMRFVFVRVVGGGGHTARKNLLPKARSRMQELRCSVSEILVGIRRNATVTLTGRFARGAWKAMVEAKELRNGVKPQERERRAE
jgi:hypothetical protein